MAGIYIHIPFCKKACYYCNFHFSTTLHLMDDIALAIAAEAKMQTNYLTETVHTIYFGGGTPSLIGVKNLTIIMEALHKNYTIATDIECTLEANPDDITVENIKAWKALGINRLSIGVQSFIDRDLEWMNRAHNSKHAIECITIAKENGITNLSIDLIYGSPELSNADWLQNIDIAMQLGIQHLSCYALTVEPNTALEKMILQLKKQPVDANVAAAQMELLMQVAPQYQLEHYEISNLALAGFRSKHNSAYWQGVNYLGLGPSAHSFNGTTRQWNIANNALYLQSIKNGTLPFEIEQLTEKNRYNEYLMTSIRTLEGVQLSKLFSIINTEKAFMANTEKYIKKNLAVLSKGYFYLTQQGRLSADGIAADLFM
jgi:oxygen-independent coproporphyrinogen III oxidase